MSAPEGDGPLVFLIAGEPSGDVLGARLMAALRRQSAGRVRFEGVGGPRMREQGLDSLFPMEEIAVMGLAEVLPRLPRIAGLVRRTAARARARRPDAVVTVDSPGFGFAVQRRLGGVETVRIHYVAPTVWAWKPWRAKQAARLLDHLIALLPFEPPFFRRHGLACTFAGHPVLESGADKADGAGFRARHGIPPHQRVLCLLPGSRAGEIRRMLPVFAPAAEILARRFPDLSLVLPTLPGMAAGVRERCRSWPRPPVILEREEEKYAAMAAADAALAASGTVALELALAGTPSVIAYRLNPLTWRIVKTMVRVRYANIVNLLLEREAVPERLQRDCTPPELAGAIAELLENPAAAESQRAACADAMRMLRACDAAPSARAAEVVLACIAERGRARGGVR